MLGIILKIVLIILLLLVIWIVFDISKGLLTKDAPRNPEQAKDIANYSYSLLQTAVRLIEHPEIEYKEMPRSSLTEENLLAYIKPLADYMAKRYDCSDFRAIWLCKLRYALANSEKYRYLLTSRVDRAICDALTGFKYFITSKGSDSMCYYSENHQMIFAVAEYFAGIAYSDAVFKIDGKTGFEHAEMAKSRMTYWFDQRGRYGFSEFYSSNYLAVDIGALSMLRTYSEDSRLIEKSELTLNMILLDYALQMYDYGFTCPAGRNYARNNTNFMASTSSWIITRKIWNACENGPENNCTGFAYLFTSLCDSGKYSVPDAIVNLGRDTAKGVIKSSSGLTLEEMKEHNLIGLNDNQIMFQLGMGALSNKEVIENTLNIINKYRLTHNRFLSAFKYFNIKLFHHLGLTKKVAAAINPFSNGMALQRNEVYTYCCRDYKLSTNQLYFPGSYGAQQLQYIACLPDGINVFTANPIDGKEFQGYGIAPCAAQNLNCMLSVYNIPEKKIPFAPGSTRPYTSTYFPEEKFDEVLLNGRFVFGRKNNTFMAIIGTSDFCFDKYENEAAFEKKIFEEYNFSEDRDNPKQDSYILKDWTKGFDLRQSGNSQYVIYEMGSSDHETFGEFVSRIKCNPVSFEGNILSYTTQSIELSQEITYILDYNGTFTVNGNVINTNYDRYDSKFVHAGRNDTSFCVKCGKSEYSFDLTKLYSNHNNA